MANSNFIFNSYNKEILIPLDITEERTSTQQTKNKIRKAYRYINRDKDNDL